LAVAKPRPPVAACFRPSWHDFKSHQKLPTLKNNWCLPPGSYTLSLGMCNHCLPRHCRAGRQIICAAASDHTHPPHSPHAHRRSSVHDGPSPCACHCPSSFSSSSFYHHCLLRLKQPRWKKKNLRSSPCPYPPPACPPSAGPSPPLVASPLPLAPHVRPDPPPPTAAAEAAAR